VGAFKVLPGLKVTFGEQLIRVYGNAAVNTGYYTFSYVKDGETKSLPARYSFTYVKNGERWLIVDHQSSAMPINPEVAGGFPNGDTRKGSATPRPEAVRTVTLSETRPLMEH
jgi:hypothetical protein